jgi:hypothetical protein
MNSYELIYKHEGLVVFYPFSGTHFEIINPLKDAVSGLEKKVLFIYCSFGGSQDEFDTWSINNPFARGLYEDVNFTQNKLGLKKIKIETYEKLTDEEFDAEFYSFDNCELLFVKGEVFKFIEYLDNKKIDLLKLNLILSYAKGFDQVLKELILKFHPIKTNEEEQNKLKILTINNHYLEDVNELFSKTTSYQSSFEIIENGEDNRQETYTVFFEDDGHHGLLKIFNSLAFS